MGGERAVLGNENCSGSSRKTPKHEGKQRRAKKEFGVIDEIVTSNFASKTFEVADYLSVPECYFEYNLTVISEIKFRLGLHEAKSPCAC